MPSQSRLALAVAALVPLLALSACGGSSSTSSAAAPALSGASSSFDGAPLQPRPAPGFTLTDQHGRPASLASLRGHVVMLSFLYTTCGDTCAIIAQQIRGALEELPSPVPVVIVTADPAADTPARVSSFLAQADLTGRAKYLTGDPAQVARVWRSYPMMRPASAGQNAFDSYAFVMLIDPEGRERVLFETEELTPEALSHDIRRLEAG